MKNLFDNDIPKAEPIDLSEPIINRTPLSEVYQEDCVEAMKRYADNHFDLAIVDPPYKNESNGLVAGFGREGFSYVHFKAPSREYFLELFRISKNQIIWGFNYFLELLPNTDSCIFWFKHQNGHFAEGELAWCSTGKTRMVDRAYQKDIGNKIHPTQKPIYLYDWLLLNYAKPNDKILDTHLGSGSSRIAAYKNGFDFTGFEIDKEYFDKQEKRFQDFKSQTRMF